MCCAVLSCIDVYIQLNPNPKDPSKRSMLVVGAPVQFSSLDSIHFNNLYKPSTLCHLKPPNRFHVGNYKYSIIFAIPTVGGYTVAHTQLQIQLQLQARAIHRRISSSSPHIYVRVYSDIRVHIFRPKMPMQTPENQNTVLWKGNGEDLKINYIYQGQQKVLQIKC